MLNGVNRYLQNSPLYNRGLVSDSRCSELIGSNGHSYVSLREPDAYRIKSRSFADLFPLMKGQFPRAEQLWQPDDEAYCGAESLTHPHLTVIPPWPTDKPSRLYFGMTLGHEQCDPSNDPNEILEIYECHSGHAAILIDRRGEPGMDLIPMKPGDKVGVPGDCIMTLFSLGNRPCVLLDVANSIRHVANKRIQQEFGPAMVLEFSYGNLRARVNPAYVGRDDGYGVTSVRTQQVIAIPAASNKPEEMYRVLISPDSARHFALRGIRVTPPELVSQLATRLDCPAFEYRESIAQIRKDRPGHPFRDYLFREDVVPGGNTIVFGGGGELGQARIQPAIAKRCDSNVDCAEMTRPQSTLFRKWFGPDAHQQLLEAVITGRYAAAHLATPPSETERLIAQLAEAPLSVLTAEKPWCSLAAARRFLEFPPSFQKMFRGFDHYLEKGCFRFLQPVCLNRLLSGEPVRRIHGHLAEPKFPSTPAQGVGIIPDLLIHLFSVCQWLLPEVNLQVVDATAARHAQSHYESETMAWVRLRGEYRSSGETIDIELAAAKCLPESLAGKRLTIESASQWLDIDIENEMVLLDKRTLLYRPQDHESTPYDVLLDRLQEGNAEVGLPIEKIVSVLELVEGAQALADLPAVTLDNEVYANRFAELTATAVQPMSTSS